MVNEWLTTAQSALRLRICTAVTRIKCLIVCCALELGFYVWRVAQHFAATRHFRAVLPCVPPPNRLLAGRECGLTLFHRLG